jgi:hypothetical protein
MNQSLEISLRAYVEPSRDNWVSSLNGLALSYNSTPHSATGFAPAYLLRGYVPVTGSSLIHFPESIPRVSDLPRSSKLKCGAIIDTDKSEDSTLRPEASEMIERFKAEWQQAQEVLLLG